MAFTYPREVGKTKKGTYRMRYKLVNHKRKEYLLP